MSALGSSNPLDSPQAWDVVVISGVTCPGIVEMGEWKRQHDFDVKKGKGTVGGTVTFVQKPPAEGTIKFLLWTAEQFAAWDTFLPLLKYDPTKKTVSAVDIYHPALDAIDVSSVVTTKIGNVVHEGKQLYSISVDFLEYFPPPNASAVSTPTQANGSPPAFTRNGNAANAQSGYEAEIAALLNKAQQP
jgi:hypothetical protein